MNASRRIFRNGSFRLHHLFLASVLISLCAQANAQDLRHCRLLAMLGVPLPVECLETEAAETFETWIQNFGQDVFGWVDKETPGPAGWCGGIERVDRNELICASDDILPSWGNAYAVLEHGECNEFWTDVFSEVEPDGLRSGPASTDMPLNSHFPSDGFTNDLDVFLDPDWGVGAGFGYAYAFQVLDEEWPNFRYAFQPVFKTENALLVGAHEVEEAGWYTFRHRFDRVGVNLTVEFELLQRGLLLYAEEVTQTLLTQEPIADFRASNVSNGYVWFVSISDDLQVAVDSHQLREGR